MSTDSPSARGYPRLSHEFGMTIVTFVNEVLFLKKLLYVSNVENKGFSTVLEFLSVTVRIEETADMFNDKT